MNASPVQKQAEQSHRNYRSLLSSAYGFSRAFSAYTGQKGLVAVFLVVFGALLEGLGLILLIPLLAVVFGTGGAGGQLQRRVGAIFHAVGADSEFSRLAAIFAIFGLVMVIRGAVITFRDVRLGELQIGFLNGEQLRIMERLAAAEWARLVGLRHARITHVIGGDIERVGTATHFLVQGIIACAMLVMQCVLAFLLAPKLALIVTLLLAAGAVALMPALRRARELGDYLTDANLALLDTTAQFLGGLKLAISQDLQSQFVAKFQGVLHAQARRQIDYIRQHTASQLALTALSAVVAAILVLVGFSVFHVAAPILITLVAVVARMSGPAGQIQQSTQQLAHALPAYEKVKNLEAELSPEGFDISTVASEPLADGAICFQDVSFVHQGDALEADSRRGVFGLNLTIAAGEFLGIAGPSGAGKTTFADLLVGLIAPQSGLITAAEQPLDKQILPTWRKSLSYISQDSFLFHETIRSNLLWACPEASDDAIWSALRMAAADPLVRRMPKGLDTVVGDRGTLISGGERQRLALAAAILRRPRLLVLDEATSAIDIASERVILSNLRALSPRPTIVIIAHRAESLAFCDRIIQFDNGCAGEKAEGLPQNVGVRG